MEQTNLTPEQRYPHKYCFHGISYDSYCRQCEIIWLEQKLEWLTNDIKNTQKLVEKIALEGEG